VKSAWKVVIGVLIGLSLVFGTASVVSGAAHVMNPTAVEY
jgi:hypothetical protein